MRSNRIITPGRSRIALVLSAVVSLCGAAGCDTIGAKPWDRDLMARRSMQPDTYPVITAINSHIEFSKEGASGGRGFSGGGCGCN